jgi:hypothetical protein
VTAGARTVTVVPVDTWTFVSAGQGYLGVRGLDLTDQLREHFGVPVGRGVMLAQVDPRGPAASAGLRVGDIVLTVGARPISSEASLAAAVRPYAAGAAVALGILRDREASNVEVTIAARPRPLIRLGRQGSSVHVQWLGTLGDSSGVPSRPEVYVEDALVELRRVLDGGDQAGYQQLPVERIDRRLLEQRIRQLEQRLAELERHLHEPAAVADP